MRAVIESKPLVSAVIPAYQAAAYVRDAVESVLQQTYRPLECIVVDDGSTDATPQVADDFGDEVRLVRQENRGVSAARNRGVREARGEFLAFLDADDCWLPARIEQQMEVFERRPKLEAVVCATQVVDAGLKPHGTIRQDPAIRVEDLLLCRASVVSASSNLLVRRGALEAIGGWDEALSTSADWAMTFRLLQRGRLATIAEPLVQYRRHRGNMSLSVAAFERDMLAAFEGVLDGPNAERSLARLRRRAYANLHRMIAGSYFVDRQWGEFARNAARSIAFHPSTLPYFLGMPLRRFRRRTTQSGPQLTSPHA
jgi:glycosyltransferase involved in cell wall biosynthesis